MSVEFSFMEDISDLTLRCYNEMIGSKARLEQTTWSETINTDSFLEVWLFKSNGDGSKKIYN